MDYNLATRCFLPLQLISYVDDRKRKREKKSFMKCGYTFITGCFESR